MNFSFRLFVRDLFFYVWFIFIIFYNFTPLGKNFTFFGCLMVSSWILQVLYPSVLLHWQKFSSPFCIFFTQFLVGTYFCSSTF